MSPVIDRLIAAKITLAKEPLPPYSTDSNEALAAARMFIAEGGMVSAARFHGDMGWRVTASKAPMSERFTVRGEFATAVCKAMLQAVGVMVVSSD